MRDNQRYFEVYTAEGKLAPHFISVRNGNAEGMKNVILGNEKFWLPVWKMLSSSGKKIKS